MSWRRADWKVSLFSSLAGFPKYLCGIQFNCPCDLEKFHGRSIWIFLHDFSGKYQNLDIVTFHIPKIMLKLLFLCGGHHVIGKDKIKSLWSQIASVIITWYQNFLGSFRHLIDSYVSIEDIGYHSMRSILPWYLISFFYIHNVIKWITMSFSHDKVRPMLLFL